ncbi:hypothetical protein UCD39_27450 [Nitrospirillum sp. BR 11752]|uniref:hypothetical protein n=1 Tax=Nitrospirillum sp. BR 11752 TaxID=3104293 RepID=UPI002EB595C9|nr:hypothetical protein [Nitrospirillum sp. BR 11752]
MRLGAAARAAGLASGVLASGVLAVGLLAANALAQSATPVPEPPGYRLDDYRAPVPATVSGGKVLTTDALRDLLARQSDRVILVDVVPAPRRPAGMAPESPGCPCPTPTFRAASGCPTWAGGR